VNPASPVRGFAAEPARGCQLEAAAVTTAGGIMEGGGCGGDARSRGQAKKDRDGPRRGYAAGQWLWLLLPRRVCLAA
jgi:hypothetical protein